MRFSPLHKPALYCLLGIDSFVAINLFLPFFYRHFVTCFDFPTAKVVIISYVANF